MKEIWRICLGALGTLAAFGMRALGGWDMALSMLLAIMGLDVLGGLIVALQGKSGKTEGGGFLSAAFFRGITRKLMMLALVALGAALDRLLDTQGVGRLTVIGFYAANEGLSIVEKAALLGLPFPKALLRVMEAMRRKGDDETGQA